MHNQETSWRADVVYTVRFHPDGGHELIAGHATADPTGTVLDEGYNPYTQTLKRPVWWRVEQRKDAQVRCSTFRVEYSSTRMMLDPVRLGSELDYIMTVETLLLPEGSTVQHRLASNVAESVGLSEIREQVDNESGPVRSGPPKPPELVLTVQSLGPSEFVLDGGSATAVPYGPVIEYGVQEVGLLKRWTHWRIEKRGDVAVSVSSFRALPSELRRLADNLPIAKAIGSASVPHWIAVEMVVADWSELLYPQMVYGRAVEADLNMDVPRSEGREARVPIGGLPIFATKAAGDSRAPRLPPASEKERGASAP